MRAHAHHGRRGRLRPGGRGAPRAARALLAGGLTLGVVGVAGAQSAGTPVVVSDRADAADGAPDIKRLSAQRLARGDVRVALSLQEALVPRDLLADARDGGPPGSLCVRFWTTSTPGRAAPDLLACVTTQADGRTLRGTISREEPDALPSTVGRATITRPSRSSVALVVPGSLFRPSARLFFAAEATKAGCARLSCIDAAPDAARLAKRLALR